MEANRNKKCNNTEIKKGQGSKDVCIPLRGNSQFAEIQSIFFSSLQKSLEYCKSISTNFTKWSNILKQFVANLLTNCLNVFDHFVGLALKELIKFWHSDLRFRKKIFTPVCVSKSLKHHETQTTYRFPNMELVGNLKMRSINDTINVVT